MILFKPFKPPFKSLFMTLESFDEMIPIGVDGKAFDHLLLAVLFPRFDSGVPVPVQLLVMHYPNFLIDELHRILVGEAGDGGRRLTPSAVVPFRHPGRTSYIPDPPSTRRTPALHHS